MAEYEEGWSEDIWANRSQLRIASEEQALLEAAARRANAQRRSSNPFARVYGHLSGFIINRELDIVDAQVREARSLPQPREY